MSDVVLVAAIAAIPATIAAFSSIILGFLNRRDTAQNGAKMDELHVRVNSRLDQLLQAKGESSFREGHAVGTKAESDQNKTLVKALVDEIKIGGAAPKDLP